MNRTRLILLPAAFAVLLAACGGTEGTPSSTPMPVASEAIAQTPSATDAPSPLAVTPSSAPSTSADAGSTGGSGETATIEIEGFAFTPAELTISAGTEVTVTNLDSAPHTFTAGSDADPQPDVFDSGLLQQGESFTFVFDEPGTFAYFCDRHPPMEGEITVTD